MLAYKNMKELLRISPEPVALNYFTKSFYKTFCAAYKAKDWTEVHTTDFYILDSCGYCHFLEIFHSTLPKWKVTFGMMEHGYPVNLHRTFIREDTLEDAKAQAERMRKIYETDFAEIESVK